MSVAPDVFDAAVARLRAGGLVAYPTETLYGVGVDARSEAAVEALRAWKGRAADQPLSVLVPDAAALESLGCALGRDARRLAAAFWPGPLTLVLDCAARLAAGVANGGLGVRCSPHPVARRLAERAAAAGVGPVTSTSLNRTGAPPARTRAEARALCASGPGGAAGGAPWLLDAPGSPEPGGIASTVVDARGGRLRVLREGAVPEAALRAVLAASGEGAAR